MLIEVGEPVRGPDLTVQGHVGDGQAPRGDGQGVAQEVAVLISTVVTVVVAEELQGVALLQGGIALGHGSGFALAVNGPDAGDIAVGGLVVEGQQQLRPAAVVEHGHIAGDGIVFPIVHGALVVVGHRLPVYRQPGLFHVSQQIALAVKVEDVVQPQVDEALAVVVEKVQVQRVDQRPLFL